MTAGQTTARRCESAPLLPRRQTPAATAATAATAAAAPLHGRNVARSGGAAERTGPGVDLPSPHTLLPFLTPIVF